jgi:uncharacterized protein (TIGR02757 family)
VCGFIEKKMKLNKKNFENIYKRYNKKEFIHPDPLEFLSKYKNIKDKEIVGLIASSLAYGRVEQIIESTSIILEIMGSSPHSFIKINSPSHFSKVFKNFKHRFTTGEEIASLLKNIKSILKRYGSLNKYFLSFYNSEDINLESAIYKFAEKLNSDSPSLIPSPEKKSSFKRFNLFLRWMIRKDTVDPGIWKGISPSKLIIPLDTHMFKVGKMIKATERNDTSMKTALEITSFFKGISPNDPVRYDFSLTRIPINKKREITCKDFLVK